MNAKVVSGASGHHAHTKFIDFKSHNAPIQQRLCRCSHYHVLPRLAFPSLQLKGIRFHAETYRSRRNVVSKRLILPSAASESADVLSTRDHISEDKDNDISQAISLRNVWFYVCISCLGPTVTGYNFGVVNVALGYISRVLQLERTVGLAARVLGSIMLSAALGSSLTWVLAEKYGRRRTLQLSAIPFSLGMIVSAAAKNLSVLMSGQIFVGIGVGIITSTVPLYIFEITPTEARGSFGSLNQLFMWMGVLVGLLTGIPLARYYQWWRIMFCIAIIPTALMAYMMHTSPESPLWLLQQGNAMDAEKSVEILWGKDKVEEILSDLTTVANTKDAEFEDSWKRYSLQNIKKVLTTAWGRRSFKNILMDPEKSFQRALYDLLKLLNNAMEFAKRNRIGAILVSYIESFVRAIEWIWGGRIMKKRLEDPLLWNTSSNLEESSERFSWLRFLPKYVDKVAIAAALVLFQQLGGVNVAMFYTVASDWLVKLPFSIIVSSVLATTLILGTLAAYLVIDKTGTKNLLIASFSGMAISLFAMMVSMSQVMDPEWSIMPIIAIQLYLAMFALGASHVPFVVVPEILPSELRVRGISFLTSLHWVSAFAIASYAFNGPHKSPFMILIGMFAVCVAAVRFLRYFIVDAMSDTEETTEDEDPDLPDESN